MRCVDCKLFGLAIIHEPYEPVTKISNRNAVVSFKGVECTNQEGFEYIAAAARSFDEVR